tara:strand:- start:402 stop:1790 length:1389 start_codon:yes stop_codon:yes gene_type:complete
MQYDLIVIGSGPAGEKGAAQVAYFGKKVALIERHKVFGGAAANTGTLPSKTLRETALMLSGLKARKLHGLDLSIRRECTVQDFLRHEKQVVSAEQSRVEANLISHGIDIYYGDGRFKDSNTVEVISENEVTTITGTKILIATGSSPFRPDTIPPAHPSIYDSDTILSLKRMPRKMVVIGGGVIGCEYACTFAALGVAVHLVNGRDQLLTFLDEEIQKVLKDSMNALGVKFITPERVASCLIKSDQEVVLTMESGTTIDCDTVLLACGRQSNTSKLQLERAGVQVGKRGLLEVNEVFQTNAEHIYAAGDVIGFPALASTSMEQARFAMDHAFKLGYKKQVAPIPAYGIYTIPEVSMAGYTESQLQDQNIDYVCGKAYYNQNARGMIVGDEHGLLKLLFERKKMKLVGVHVIGESASELVHAGLIALMSGANNELFISTCFNYPTLSELYKYATYDAMGKVNSK